MTQWLQADGKRLEAEWHGPGPSAAPTLVFLHEGLGSVAQWRDFPARLADALGLGALIYSRAGYGKSDPVTLPRPLSYMEHEGEVVLPQVLEAAGVRDAVLVGHSDGGSIALAYAGTHGAAGRVRALVLEAPHVFCEDVSVAAITRAREAYEREDLRERLAKYHREVDVAFWGWNRAWLDPGFRAWNIERYLPAVRVPVLVVQGEQDPYGTIKQVEAIERGVLGAKRLMIPNCGHAPHREEEEVTLQAMRAFVRQALGQPTVSS